MNKIIKMDKKTGNSIIFCCCVRFSHSTLIFGLFYGSNSGESSLLTLFNDDNCCNVRINVRKHMIIIINRNSRRRCRDGFAVAPFCRTGCRDL